MGDEHIPQHNMRKVTGLSLICTVAVLTIQSASCPSGQCAPTSSGERFSVQVREFKRSYRLHLPPTYDGKTPVPLVLVFHGRSEGARDIAEITQFNAVADQRGFIVVYPIGIREHWNDGRLATPIFAAGNYDDVGFVAALLTHVEATFAIDPRRIYATGMSNGGMFVQRLACELDGTFAAIGPVDGTLPSNLVSSCTPKEPVSVIEFHGTRDAYVHWEGGSVRAIGGKTLSVPQTIAHWQQQNGCPNDVTIEYVPAKNTEDPTRVRREQHGPCREGSAVVLYAVEGGGHTWPGGPSDHSLPFLGQVTQHISATETMANFFEQHPKISRLPSSEVLLPREPGSVRTLTPTLQLPQPRSMPTPTPMRQAPLEFRLPPMLMLLKLSLNLPLAVHDSLIDRAFGDTELRHHTNEE